jgi:hypothetical protein
VGKIIIHGRAGTTLEQIYPQLPISYISLYPAVSAFLIETFNIPSLQFPPKAMLSAKGGIKKLAALIEPQKT